MPSRAWVLVCERVCVNARTHAYGRGAAAGARACIFVRVCSFVINHTRVPRVCECMCACARAYCLFCDMKWVRECIFLVGLWCTQL